jgi:nitroreductase
MDIIEAVTKRMSIRAFKPDPVPQATLKELMELAIRAPSWGNTQPWDFIIVTGKKLDEIKQGFADKADQEMAADVARPQDFPEPYASRRRTLAIRPPETPAGAPPSPRRMANPKLYGAPVVIYILTGRSFYFQPKGINAWPVYDCGLISENIMLLAPHFGLGSIALAQAVTHPEILRNVLGIPDSQIVVLGIGIGYPDWNDPMNQRRSGREPLDNVTKWVGF